MIRITYHDTLVTILDTYHDMYRDTKVAIQYAYRRHKYRDASMHRCIVTISYPYIQQCRNYLESQVRNTRHKKATLPKLGWVGGPCGGKGLTRYNPALNVANVIIENQDKDVSCQLGQCRPMSACLCMFCAHSLHACERALI